MLDVRSLGLIQFLEEDILGGAAGAGLRLEEKEIRQPQKRRFIIGAPDDADSVKWAKKMTDIHGIPWHGLPVSRKDELVAPEFIEAIAQALVGGEWKY